MKITKKQLRQVIKEELRLLEADRDGDGKLSPGELRGLAGDLDGKPNRPPSIPLRPSGVESMRAQKMANLDPLADGFDQDFMRLANAVIELEYSGYGGIIDALIDLGD